MKELWTGDIADAVADENRSPHDRAFGEATDVGRDQAEGERDVGREDAAETQARHSACTAVQGIDHNHADHGGQGVEDHDCEADVGDQSCDGGAEDEEDQLGGSEGHLD